MERKGTDPKMNLCASIIKVLSERSERRRLGKISIFSTISSCAFIPERVRECTLYIYETFVQKMPKEFCLCEHLQFLYALSMRAPEFDWLRLCSGMVFCCCWSWPWFVRIEIDCRFSPWFRVVFFVISFSRMLAFGRVDCCVQVKPWTAHIYHRTLQNYLFAFMRQHVFVFV